MPPVGGGGGCLADGVRGGGGGGSDCTTAPVKGGPGCVVSERYPLGKKEQFQFKDYHRQDRYHLAQSSTRFPSNEWNGLERPQRHSRTPSPSSERYHALDKGREKYQGDAMESTGGDVRLGQASTQSACSIERYTPTERHRRGSNAEIYKVREGSSSTDRKEMERLQREYRQDRFAHEQYVVERFNRSASPADRLGANAGAAATTAVLACPPPEPFAGTSPAEPPSPAPTSDRFVPPPPAPTLTPEEPPDCYAHGAFPSPTAQPAPAQQERFVPPPPLPPSPTDFAAQQKELQAKQRYLYSPNQSSERYILQYKQQKSHLQDKYPQAGFAADRYHQVASSSSNSSTGSGYGQQMSVRGDHRFGVDRYLPPNAHMPVERYVPQPQPQELYYGTYQPYERFGKQFNASDPYMRRDLTYHYRLPISFTQNQFQKIRYSHLGTPSRAKCCQYDQYQLAKSSPGSSSSNSSVASNNTSSLQDVQCQNSYQGKDFHYQQEKGTQCDSPATAQPQHASLLVLSKGSCAPQSACRHSVCEATAVEYVGASGGRHVCTTPPPRLSERCEGCVQAAAAQAAAQAAQRSLRTAAQQQQQPTANWRASPPQPLQQASNRPPPEPTQPTTQPQQLVTPHHSPPPTASQQPTASTRVPTEQPNDDASPRQRQAPQASSSPPRGSAAVQRAISMPTSSVAAVETTSQAQPKRVNYSQSERIPNRTRPPLNRSTSRKEMIKNYIKKETANFFGVDEENENEEQLRWLDRRKRMAWRTMGPLKDEFCKPSYRPRSQHARAASDVTDQAATTSRAPPPRMPGRPDVLPLGTGDGDAADGFERAAGAPQTIGLRRKDSVARMTWNGLSYMVTTLTRHRQRTTPTSSWSRSYPSEIPPVAARDVVSTPDEERAFFEKPPADMGGADAVDRGARLRIDDGIVADHVHRRYSANIPPGGWRRDHEDVVLRHGEQRPSIGISRILSNTLDHVLDNSDRRMYGMGWVGRLFGRTYRRSVITDSDVRRQLDDMDDHRPLFTYWVTTVQVLVLLISIACYGFGPFGVNLQAKSGQVLVTSLSLQQVDYTEPANFWFGPRAADLIHLGAKFAPCMRNDDKITQQIEKIRKKEKETACCIRNDDSGCVQSSQADCSKIISKWKKWTSGDAGPGGRISGSVCGLDPKYCDAPASVHPYEWPDDITKWPICRKARREKGSSRDKPAEHMVCEVIGHPCCIGIHGQCRITTREYCDFVRGTFHEEASLCSQVSCLNDVCGMIPFYLPDVPDQFYRLWTSLFLHAGVLQLLITVLVQHFLMRDLEKLTGSLRIAIIYIGSGVAGNLASAIFVPYRADVGPAGSQFGLLACLVVEVLNARPMLKHPNQALCKLLAVTAALFVVGLLPWVDNFAHLFGFAFGFLLSYALLPFVSFGPYDRHKKVFLIWVCLIAAGTLFVCLVLLFYIIPVYDCRVCSYFNCLPLTRDFCASQNINFKREEPVV
ncbi:inactive rhomboid protein 1 isoform X2 [Cylas formicarius]|uniref:inactive rhomboid protein 1 isoform X2 n=1 Tax=Cylas formicarius TaxID=197179 RepID=UPI0029585D43|nr:inactive rhomboid protein 1 isoform X2 [Cylas formicarius]